MWCEVGDRYGHGGNRRKRVGKNSKDDGLGQGELGYWVNEGAYALVLRGLEGGWCGE